MEESKEEITVCRRKRGHFLGNKKTLEEEKNNGGEKRDKGNVINAGRIQKESHPCIKKGMEKNSSIREVTFGLGEKKHSKGALGKKGKVGTFYRLLTRINRERSNAIRIFT